MTDYEIYLRQRGVKQGSINTCFYRLANWLPVDVAIGSIQKVQLEKTYRRRCKQVSVATHQQELAQVKTFFAWCRKKGYVKANPVEDIEPVGRRNRGKEQLRRGETQRLYAACLTDGSQQGLAVALCLHGLRSGEVRGLTVRDIDGNLVWVAESHEGKTEAAQRHFSVLPDLAHKLGQLAAGRHPAELLWGNKRRGKDWLGQAVTKMCEKAGVPRVTPHGLRGTFSSLTAEVGVPVEMIAKAMGHTGANVTRQHYLGSGSEHAGKTRRLLRLVGG